MKSKFLLLAALGFGAVPAAAQDIPAALERCASLSDDHARLSCYDGIAAGFKHAAAPVPQTAAVPQAQASVPPPPPPAVAPVPAPTVAPPPTVAAKIAAFGADTIRKPETVNGEPKDVDEIRATVTQVEFSPTNRFIVTLDNGQVWRQIDGDSTKARFRKGGDAVTISRGLFSSYNLSIDGHDIGLYKVRRIR